MTELTPPIEFPAQAELSAQEPVAVAEAPLPAAPGWLTHKPFAAFPNLTVETLLFAAILIFAIITRFYDLGTRVMSHDESLHTYYSWNLYRGQGYQHNPMMHGPLQFHMLALSYFIFGVSDFTARIPAALFSIAAVAALWYWRRYLGRFGALVAALMMVISPYMLFYGRYVRNEAFVALYGILALYAVLRYLENGQARYLYLLTAATALHFTVKETAFIYTAELLIFLLAYFVSSVTRAPWGERKAEFRGFIISMGATILGLGGALAIAYINQKTKAPVNGDLTGAGTQLALPSAIAPFEISLAVIGLLGLLAAGFFLVRGLSIERLRQERSLDLFLLLGTLIVPTLIPFPMVMAGLNPLDYTPTGLLYTSLFIIPVFIVAAMIGYWWNWNIWWRAAALFYIIFTVFYTTLFTNGAGFFTGLVGSLGYWLEQQGVERGSQPWYFYLLIQIPVYEFLPFFASLLAAALGFRRLKRENPPAENLSAAPEGEFAAESPALPPDAAPESLPATEQGNPLFLARPVDSVTINLPNTFALLGWWSVASVAAFTLAGEKMPWITVHLALPMILWGGWAIGDILERIEWKELRRRNVFVALGLTLVFIFSAVGIFLAWNNPIPPFSGKELSQLQTTTSFVLAVIGLFASGAGLFYLLNEHWPLKQAIYLTLISFFGLLAVLTTRAAFRATYINYDSGMEYLVYAHGYTGNKDALRQVMDLSEKTTGDPYAIKVAYDDDTSWPMSWYMREFPNAVFYGSQPNRDLRELPAIIVGDNNFSKIEPIVGKDYLRYDYIRMVWPNQDYFGLTPERFANAISDPAVRAGIFDIWLNRDYSAYAKATGRESMTNQNWDPSDRMRLYIRKDVANQLWNYGAAPVEQVVSDPYAGKATKIEANLVFGEIGQNLGQFDAPRGLAFAPDGSLYVADSRNHRIQHFDAEGNFINQWGTFGDLLNTGQAPIGTLDEPWGVAVGPDGSVYVSDTWNHRIQKFSAEGKAIKMWGIFGLAADASDALYGPRGISIDSAGHIFVADTGNKRIVIFDSEGNLLNSFGSEGVDIGQFYEPVDVKIGPDGNAYVTDTWNHRVQVFAPGGADGLSFTPLLQWEVSGWLSETLDNKPYIAIAPNGHVFVTDPEGYRVIEFTAEGLVVRVWGDYGAENFAFTLPSGIISDAAGNIWVTDAGYNRVMRFTLP
ncbi:MAG: hypothetical protein CO094_01515 [Anaerolineae bacterium CG_4_9_14_3_um_filter_57_17]|nr:TIGR03663 family protein [bacterium]NCT19597.1 TIGR03663 family protein [bacterium]OIO85435.1 MAG: hypothetical protein AUK01_06190 [Anaerolineae bacterium CG2_30_57_67]PJB68322.1 MAG: hypothetical protein CO094_01515 [Anaerolineae bacterium CG_4_9_14_3_um_filter_57_17]